eukprot:gene4404-5158_t
MRGSSAFIWSQLHFYTNTWTERRLEAKETPQRLQVTDLSLDPTSLYKNGVAEGMVLGKTKNVTQDRTGKPLSTPDLDLTKPKNYGMIINQTCFESFFKFVQNISIPLAYNFTAESVSEVGTALNIKG